MGLRRRKIRRRQDSSSSSSSSSSSASRASASRRSSSSSYFDMPDGESGDDNDGDETERRGRRRRRHREEEVEVERPAVLDKPRAKCRYRALTDLRKRCGKGPRFEFGATKTELIFVAVRRGHFAPAGPSLWTTASATSVSSRVSRSPSNWRAMRDASTLCTSTPVGAGGGERGK